MNDQDLAAHTGSLPRLYKMLALLAGDEGHRAAAVYVFGLSYAREQHTWGFIPDAALPLIHGCRADAERLVAVRLWLPARDGWLIHDWLPVRGCTCDQCMYEFEKSLPTGPAEQQP